MRSSSCLTLVLVTVMAGAVASGAESRIPLYQAQMLPGPGSYYLSEDIDTSGSSLWYTSSSLPNEQLTIDLNGMTVYGLGAPAISISETPNVELRNGTVTGGAIEFYGCRNVVLRDLSIDAGSIVCNLGSGNNQNVRVESVSLTNGSMTFHNTSHLTLRRVTIAKGSLLVDNSDNVEIREVSVSDPSGSDNAIQIIGSRHVGLEDVSAAGSNGYAPLIVSLSDNVAIVGCRFARYFPPAHVRLQWSNDVLLSQSVVNGIDLVLTQNAHLIGNTFQDEWGGPGAINVDVDSLQTVVQGNRILDCYMQGIQSDGNGTTIDGNTIVDATGTAVSVSGPANVITANLIDQYGGYGIEVRGEDAVVTENTIRASSTAYPAIAIGTAGVLVEQNRINLHLASTPAIHFESGSSLCLFRGNTIRTDFSPAIKDDGAGNEPTTGSYTIDALGNASMP